MDDTDEKLISLLDLIIARDEVTKNVRPTLQRLALYYEHFELMEQLDPTEVLFNDIHQYLAFMYRDAISTISSSSYANSFSAHYEKLSATGLDAYWAGDIRVDQIPDDYIYWR